MKGKFSGFCYLTIENHEIIDNEQNDYSFIGEFDWFREDIDFEYDILDGIKEDDALENLEDGRYYVYFDGVAEFGSEYCHEYGCYEGYSQFELNYTHYQKLDEVEDADVGFTDCP
jgi:hypothetical protein